jgi:hypothetical protein
MGRLRQLEQRREALVARSAQQREEVRAMLQPAALRLAAADSLLAGLSRVLYWAVRLLPLYSLLRRVRRGERSMP